ncbi:hypothetical protein F4777DRAFT_564555 [Nemania sp. FL0916]|nr:hypothetical protein F4777DRAFT_564555 [Nemania sp. FL0916]
MHYLYSIALFAVAMSSAGAAPQGPLFLCQSWACQMTTKDETCCSASSAYCCKNDDMSCYCALGGPNCNVLTADCDFKF